MVNQKTKQSLGKESGIFYGYFIVAAAIIIISAMWAIYYSFGVFFKPVLNEFGWTRAMTSGAFSLASIISGLLAIAMGGVTDKFGPRMVMTLCGLFLGTGCFLMSQLSAVWQLYLFFGVIVGIGMGGAFIPLLSTIARWFVKKRGMMTGIVAAGTGIGALVGPPVASRFISMYGWRASYAIMGCIVFAVVVLAAQLIKKDPAQVGLVAYGAHQGEQKGLNPGSDGISLMEAVCTNQFWVFFGTGFCYGFCVFATMVHIAPHATELGISATRAANILATIGALSIVGKVSLGRVGDTIGNRQTLIIGFILMSAALFGLVPAKTPLVLYLLAGVFGFAFGGCAVSHSPLVAVLFGLRSHGLIFGFFGVSVMTGGAIGPWLAGYLFDVTGSYQQAFFVCGAISFSGIVLTAVLKQRMVK
jgi:MFS family permease